MKKLVIGVILLVLLTGSLACARSATVGSVPPAPQPAPAPVTTVVRQVPAPTIVIPAPTTPSVKGDQAASGSSGAQNQTGQELSPDRMIVRTGNLSLIVENVASSIDQIGKYAESFGGYIVASNSWREGERLVGTISVRVPVERFNDAIRAFRGLAVDVRSETTTSKDVTEEYTDLSAKLKNLEAAEKQLLQLMEKAQKVEDILAIQRELTRTRGEIEQTKGRMQYLERTSSTSLIEVGLEQAKLETKFVANKSRVKAREDVRFSGQVAGGFTPYSYEWNFGDGQTSTEVSPLHSYKSPGNFTVTLKVTDDRGNTDTEIRKDYITVLPGWDAGGVASSAWNGLVIFGRVVADILIWLGIFSPVWIIIGGIAYFVWRRRRKKT